MIYSIIQCVKCIQSYEEKIAHIHDIEMYDTLKRKIVTLNTFIIVRNYLLYKLKCKHDTLEKETCSICLEVIHEHIKKTSCNHFFHAECLNTWFLYNLTCPYCREYQHNEDICTCHCCNSFRFDL
jgi:hypothetical protein